MLESKTKIINALLEHPALWQAAQCSGTSPTTHTLSPAIVSSGFKVLDNLLSQGGWPLGQLIECLGPQPCHGGLDLFFPAIRKRLTTVSNAPVILVAPPHAPYLEGWQQYIEASTPLWCVSTQTFDERLWAVEQILNSNSASVVILWLYPESKKRSARTVKVAQLRRLQLAARRSDSLVIVMRNQQAQQQPSPAPLRIALQPAAAARQTVLSVKIIKQAGKWGGQRINIPWHSRLQHPPLPVEQWPVHRSSRQDSTTTDYRSPAQLPELPGATTKWS